MLGKVKQLDGPASRPDRPRRPGRRPRHHVPPVRPRPARRRAGRADPRPGHGRPRPADRPGALPGRAGHAARGDPGQRARRDRVQARGPGRHQPRAGRRQRPLPRADGLAPTRSTPPRRPRTPRPAKRTSWPPPPLPARPLRAPGRAARPAGRRLPLPQLRSPTSSRPTSVRPSWTSWPPCCSTGSARSRTWSPAQQRASDERAQPWQPRRPPVNCIHPGLHRVRGRRARVISPRP